MPDPLPRLERDIRNLVNEALRHHTPFDQLKKQIADLIRHANVGGKLADELLQEAKKQFDWIGSRTLTPQDRAGTQTIFNQSATEYARIGDAINRKVVKVLDRSLSIGLKSSEIEQLVRHAVQGSDGNAKAITATALGGFDRVDTFRQADEAGVDRFQYAGPGAQRPFCRTMMQLAGEGVTYTRAEIEQISNGLGLSVLYFCGGWHCRHHWQPVITP